MRRGQRKRAHLHVIRTTISLTPALVDEFQGIAVRGGFTGLSSYVQACIRRDAKMIMAEVVR